MTPLSVPNEGELAMLVDLLSFDHVLHLFKNNITPNNATILSNLTEADFAGYSAPTLLGGGWVTSSGDPSVATYAAQTFTCSATGVAQTVYGYYLTRGGVIRWCELFPTSRLISVVGASITVNPRITLQDSGD